MPERNALLAHHSLAVTQAENVINILFKHAPLRYADLLTEGLSKLEVKHLVAHIELEPERLARSKAARLRGGVSNAPGMIRPTVPANMWYSVSGSVGL